MQVFTPSDVSKHAANKYLSVLIAAKFARVLNDFPRDRSAHEKKLTTRALEELANGEIEYRDDRPGAAPFLPPSRSRLPLCAPLPVGTFCVRSPAVTRPVGRCCWRAA